MRFRKGSRVEVFSNKEAPYGAWRCAEIISGNGHTYNVRFYSSQLAHDEAVMVRVPRKIIRPCPPQVDVQRWETGELVEVLDNFSWKAATVLVELCGKYYVVRLLGTPAELTFHQVNLRVRQSWQDEKWVAIGKISGSVKSSTLTESDVHQKLQPHTNSILIHEPSVVSARMLKRPSPYNWSECAESCTGNPKKIRSLEKEGQKHRFLASSMQKVDAIACRPENRGGKSHVQASFNNHETGCCQMVRVRSKGFSESVRAGSLVADDCSDPDACSVGSCSATSYDESKMPPCMLDGSSQQADSCSSDAESSCGLGEEARRKHSSAGDGARRSCRSELYTYRSTLGELFSSGPLSWEQEASLTDLRLSLNISDDEHLMERHSHDTQFFLEISVVPGERNQMLGDRCQDMVEQLDASRLNKESKAGLVPVKSSDLVKEKLQRMAKGPKRGIGGMAAGDISRPENREYYMALKSLKEHMVEIGYVPESKVALHDVDQESKVENLFNHHERLAFVSQFLNTPARSSIRVLKNVRVCIDCHNALKLMSKIVGRELVSRDAKRFLRMKDGVCSCREYW